MTRARIVQIIGAGLLAAAAASLLPTADAAAVDGRLPAAVDRARAIYSAAQAAGLQQIAYNRQRRQWTATNGAGPCHHDGTAWRCTSATGPRHDGAAQAARWGMRDLQHLGGGRMMAACRRATSHGAMAWRTCFFDGANWRAGRI